MGLRIRSNLQSLQAKNHLAKTTRENDESMAKIASGYRINKAADDSAGLAISEKLKADVRSLNMAKRNANDGISLLQVAEGSMNEINNILTRLRELAIQSASDTIGDKERSFAHKEFNQLKAEIDRITHTAEFNGTLLLSGTEDERGDFPEGLSLKTRETPIEIQVGKDWHESIDSRENADEPFDENPTNVIRVSFNKYFTTAEALNLGQAGDESMDSTGLYLPDDEKNSRIRAQKSINKVDDAITKIVEYRSEIGAAQSRLNSTVSTLTEQALNENAANSRIRDTDFAEETARLAHTNILKQSGVAVLAQANQDMALTLQLLR